MDRLETIQQLIEEVQESLREAAWYDKEANDFSTKQGKKYLLDVQKLYSVKELINQQFKDFNSCIKTEAMKQLNLPL